MSVGVSTGLDAGERAPRYASSGPMDQQQWLIGRIVAFAHDFLHQGMRRCWARCSSMKAFTSSHIARSRRNEARLGQALQNNRRLLLLRPTPPPACLHHLEAIRRTDRMAVHTYSSQPSNHPRKSSFLGSLQPYRAPRPRRNGIFVLVALCRWLSSVDRPHRCRADTLPQRPSVSFAQLPRSKAGSLI